MSLWKDRPDACDLVKAALAEGLTASQISKKLYQELKIDVSRNAVIGYIHRTAGLKFASRPPGRHEPRGAKRRVRKPRPRKHYEFYNPDLPKRRDQPRLVKTKEPASRPPRPVEPPPEVVVGLDLGMADLHSGQCAWPTNDDVRNARYCGHPTGGPRIRYCPWHDSVAHGRPGQAAKPVRERNRYA